MAEDISFELEDGQTGSQLPFEGNKIAYLGAAAGGTANAVLSIGSDNALAPLGIGPLRQAVKFALAIAGGDVLATKMAQTAGTVTAPATDGSNPTMTATGAPNSDGIELAVKITKAGAVGTSTFRYTTDAWRTSSLDIFTAATFPVPDTGITLGFPVGTYVLDKEYVFTSTPPSHSIQNIVDAMNATIGQMQTFGRMYVLGTTSGVDDAAKATAFAALAAACNATAEAAFVAGGPAIHVFVEAPEVSDAALLAATASLVTPRVSWFAAPAIVQAQEPTRQARMNAGRIFAPRVMRMPLGKHPAQVKAEGVWAGAMPSQVLKLLRNEADTPGLSKAPGRFVTLRTRAGKTGFFLSGWPTGAAVGSDYSDFPRRDVADAVCNGIKGVMQDQLYKDLEQRTDGSKRLTEGQAAAIDEDIEDVGNDIAGNAVSKLRFRLDRNEPTGTSGNLVGDLDMVGKLYPKGVKLRIGFTNNIPTEVG